VTRHLPLVQAAARRLVAGAGADDVVQAAFLVLARKAARIDASRSLAGWLHGVSTRLALNARRQLRRRCESPLEAAMQTSASPPAQATAAFAAHIDEALARLPERERTAILLHHVQGRSQAEIARLHGVAEGTVASWASRGRERLRRHLAGHGLAVEGAVLTGLCAALAAPAASAEQVAVTSSVAAGAAPASAGVAALAASLAWSWSVPLVAAGLGLAGLGLGTALVLGGEPAPREATASEPPPIAAVRAGPVVTPYEAGAGPAFEEIVRLGGPRILAFPGLPDLLVPPPCRGQALESRVLVQRVAAHAGLQVAWLRHDRYALLHRPVADDELEQVRKDLADPRIEMRRAAAKRAGWLDDPRAVPLLVTAAQDRDPHVAGRARIGLRRAGWDLVLAVSADAAPLLLDDLRSPEARIRQRAVHGFYVLAEAQALPPLELALGDGDDAVRSAACTAMGRLGGARAFARLEALVDGPEAFLRLGALEQLARHGDQAVIARLAAHFASLAAQQRRGMAYIIARAASPQADGLLETMLADAEPEVRFGTMDGLGWATYRPRPGLMPGLERACVDPDAAMRRLAVWALGSVADPRSLELLERAIAGSDDKIRRKASYAVFRAGVGSATPILMRLLQHQNRTLAGMAMQALGNIGNEDACARIEQALVTVEDEVFADAMCALSRVGGARAVQLLEGCLNQPRDIEGWAIELLGNIGSPRHQPLLEPLLDHPARLWRHKAVGALLRIGGAKAQAALLRRLAVEKEALMQIRRQLDRVCMIPHEHQSRRNSDLPEHAGLAGRPRGVQREGHPGRVASGSSAGPALSWMRYQHDAEPYAEPPRAGYRPGPRLPDVADLHQHPGTLSAMPALPHRASARGGRRDDAPLPGLGVVDVPSDDAG
jgi:RNA polymerase sigma factor (sigma-70 family)